MDHYRVAQYDLGERLVQGLPPRHRPRKAGHQVPGLWSHATWAAGQGEGHERLKAQDSTFVAAQARKGQGREDAGWERMFRIMDDREAWGMGYERRELRLGLGGAVWSEDDTGTFPCSGALVWACGFGT